MKKLLVIFLIVIILVIATIIWWRQGLSPANPKESRAKIFVVQKGSGLKEIASELAIEGLIKDRIVFFLYTRIGKFEQKFQAGSFRLSPSMSAQEISESLTHGILDIWITIPEGQRAEEIADTLEEKIPSYDTSWRNILILNEGYLFPDTYLIPKDADINLIISIMKDNFYAKIKSVGLSQDFNKLKEIITIASLIEREALKNEEKPIIASVIYNRLNDGMSLDIDATLQYIKGKDLNGKWWGFPTIEDKKINSPYNTYLIPGLPPFPISNPGIEAILAALNPKQSNYYYYIHDPEGNVHFGETLQQHNENINKYGVN